MNLRKPLLFDRGVDKTIRMGMWLSAGATLLIVALLVVDVFIRTFFNLVLPGTVELVELLMVVTVFMALAYTSLSEGHVTVDLLYLKLPKRVQVILNSLTSLLCMLVFGLFSWQIGERAWENVWTVTPLETSMLRVPFSPFLFIAALGNLLFCLYSLVRFLDSVFQKEEIIAKREK
jgi:TRAP-type C4-dicarboxylate transport system permease small subunit